MINTASHSYPLSRLLALVRGENPPIYSTEGMYYDALQACITRDVGEARVLLRHAADDIEFEDPERAAWIRIQAEAA
jgi:hypothetical protein